MTVRRIDGEWTRDSMGRVHRRRVSTIAGAAQRGTIVIARADGLSWAEMMDWPADFPIPAEGDLIGDVPGLEHRGPQRVASVIWYPWGEVVDADDPGERTNGFVAIHLEHT